MDMRFGYGVAAFFFLGSFWLFIVALNSTALHRTLDSSGKTVIGTVQAVYERSGTSTGRNSARTPTEHIDVAYQVNGSKYYKDFDVNESALLSFHRGDEITVHFDPANPEAALLDERWNALSVLANWLQVAGCLALGIGSAFATWYKIKQMNKMDEEDELAVNSDRTVGAPTSTPQHTWSSDPLKEDNPGDFPVK